MPQTNIILDLICFTETFVWSLLLFLRRKWSRSFVFAWQIFLGISLIFLFLGANQLHYLSVSLVLNFLYPFILPYILILSLFYLHRVFKRKSEFPGWYSLLFILPALIFTIYNHAFYFHYPLKEVILHFYDLLASGSKYEAFNLIYDARKLLFWIFVFGLAMVITIQVKWITAIIRHHAEHLFMKRRQALRKNLRIILISIFLESASLIYLLFPGWHVFSGIFRILFFFILGWSMFYSVHRKNLVKNDFKPYVDDRLKILLLEYFEEKKPWLIPDLKKQDVIHHLGTNRTYFWKLMNEDLNTNFNAFVNQYRMKEVLRLLDQEKKITMQELVERTGFKNYSTFFKVFYKEKGMAPSEYIKKQKDF